MKNTKNFIAMTLIFSLIAIAAACGGAATPPSASNSGMKKIMDKKVSDNLVVTLSNPEGKLKNGQQDLMLTFQDGAGKPVDIKAASLNFNMPAMGSMAEMNDAATLSTTATPGQFTGKVKLQMAGEWIAQISYEGAQTGKTTMTLNAQ